MHELSIISSVVESVTEALADYPGARVKAVRLRVGALASVVEDSLLFCYELATEGTPLAGSKLVIETVPVVGFCAGCQAEVQIASVQSMRCPRCQEPILDLRQGRELEIDSFEIDDECESPGGQQPKSQTERIEASR